VSQRFHTITLWRRADRFAAYVWRRFSDAHGLHMAASLSYASLLAVVPLAAIGFAVLAAFPGFAGVREEMQEFIFRNLLPEAASAASEYFDRFIDNTASLTAVGVVGLTVTAALLLADIESALNGIFRVQRTRPLVPRLLAFWAVITLGPLLLGASFSLSAYVSAATGRLGVDALAGPLWQITRLAPLALVILVFGALYLIIPNRPVNVLGAVLGAAAAGLLFSGLRVGFGAYVSSFPFYQTVYGALSVVPIFLVWMFLSWTVVLLGAAFAASFGEWRSAGGEPGEEEGSGRRLLAALEVLAVLAAAGRAGGAASRWRLLKETALGDAQLDRLLSQLRGKAYVEETARGQWVLTRDLASATLFDLYRALGLAAEGDALAQADEAWRRRLRERLAGLGASQREALDVCLRDLLAAGGVEVVGTAKEAAP
jgi:membrane protein